MNAGSAGKPQIVTSGRALADLADLVQRKYAVAVTYEEAPWTWRGEVGPMGPNPNAKWGLFPVSRSLDVSSLASGSKETLARCSRAWYWDSMPKRARRSFR